MGKFKIPVIPPTNPCSIRFPVDLIEDVEKLIEGKSSSFSAFVVAATRYVVDELKNTKDNNNFILK